MKTLKHMLLGMLIVLIAVLANACYWLARDLHPLANAHAERTKKTPCSEGCGTGCVMCIVL